MDSDIGGPDPNSNFSKLNLSEPIFPSVKCELTELLPARETLSTSAWHTAEAEEWQLPISLRADDMFAELG